mmetsp:Transcript_50938/g.74516  ORF Transcript_50938/g.74516 Transcript_50938/m.74516 type:complete len:462 (+) Transcript_50938:17-1402(+)
MVRWPLPLLAQGMYGYGENKCPARFKCYPAAYQDGAASSRGGYQCLCDRTLMFGGDDCSQVNPLVLCTCFVRVWISIFTLWRGFTTLNHILRRRYTRRTTPLAAIWTCVCQLVVNIDFVIFYFSDLLYAQSLVGSWFHPWGRIYMQELGTGFMILTSLSMSHYFFEKMKHLGFISGRLLMCFRVVFITLQLFVPGVTFWYRVAGVANLANGSYYLSLLRVVPGLLCTASLMSSATLIQRLIKRAAASTNDQSFAATAFLNTQRLTSFVKKSFVATSLILVSTASLHYVEQNHRKVSALTAHALLIAQFFAFIMLSNNYYTFLHPAQTIANRYTSRALPGIAFSLIRDLVQEQQWQREFWRRIQFKARRRRRLVVAFQPSPNNTPVLFAMRRKKILPAGGDADFSAGQKIIEQQGVVSASQALMNHLPFSTGGHAALSDPAAAAVDSHHILRNVLYARRASC